MVDTGVVRGGHPTRAQVPFPGGMLFRALEIPPDTADKASHVEALRWVTPWRLPSRRGSAGRPKQLSGGQRTIAALPRAIRLWQANLAGEQQLHRAAADSHSRP